MPTTRRLESQSTPTISKFIPKTRILTKLSIFTIVLLYCLELFVSNQLATSGTQLKEAEDAVNRLTAENKVLQQQITEQTSISNLMQQADELGYHHAPEIINLTPKDTIALGQ